MMRNILFLGVLVLSGVLYQLPASAQEASRDQLKAATAELETWLGTDANADSWRKYLLLKWLHKELANPDPNTETLLAVWRRFSAGEAGLEKEKFQNVKKHLDVFLNDRLQASRAKVADLAKDADKFAAPSAADIAKAEAELRQAAAAVSAQLNRLPVAQRSAARKFVGEKALADMAAGRKATDEQLQSVAAAIGKFKWRRYEKKYVDLAKEVEGSVPLEYWSDPVKVNGFETAAFSRLRNAIERLRNLRLTAAEDAATGHPELVSQLAEQLKLADKNWAADTIPVAIKPVEKADPDNAGSKLRIEDPLKLPANVEAALLLGRLQRSGQTPALAREIVRGYSLPNLSVYVTGNFFSGGLDSEIDRVRPVNDVILGTSVHGTAHVVGETRVSMLTNPLHAGYAINLGAVANSNTVGYNGPVTIFSTGVTQLHGQKKIHFDDELGGMKPDPATATATTNTSINNICARSRLVTRIAWKRAMASKAEAEAIASGKAAANLQGEMDQQAVQSTGNVNKGFEDKFRRPLIIRGEYPRTFLTASSSKQMQVVIGQLDEGQLGAPTLPPVAPPGDMVAQIHESYVLNYGRAMLAGQTFSALEMRQMMEQMGGKPQTLEEVKAEQEAESEGEAVYKLATSFITFDDEVPLRAEFRKGHVLLVMRFARTDRPALAEPLGKELESVFNNVEISALYTITPKNGDFVLQRDEINEKEERGQVGENKPEPIVERGVYSAFYKPVTATGRAKSRADIARRNFTNRLRREAFPVEIRLGPLDFSKRQASGQAFGNWSKLEEMKTTTAEAEQGWLNLAWTLPPHKMRNKRPADFVPFKSDDEAKDTKEAAK